MPKKRDDFEWYMLWAFTCGMTAGYGIDHGNLTEDEANALRKFAEDNGFKRKSMSLDAD